MNTVTLSCRCGHNALRPPAHFSIATFSDGPQGTTGDHLPWMLENLRMPGGQQCQARSERICVMQQPDKVRVFQLGQIVATPGALAVLQKAGQDPSEFLTRHAGCDWGDLDHSDQKENEYALKHGLRLLSSYRTNAGGKSVDHHGVGSLHDDSAFA